MNKKFVGLFLLALIMLSSRAFSALKIDDVDEENLLPIHLFAREGNIEELKKLMEKYGHHIDEEDAGTEERTPLHLAAHHGHADCVAWLLKEGADINKKNAHGWTALHYAVDGNHETCVHILLDNGADSTIRNHAGQKAEALARSKNYAKILQLFVLQAPEEGDSYQKAINAWWEKARSWWPNK